MSGFKNIKERQCEANKKVSYSQRSPIETKQADAVGEFGEKGQSFMVLEGEVIESALFERVTRDCKGDIIRKVPVRRFRKVSSDEWFSVPASIGNDSWSNNFSQASDEEAMKQAESNQNANGEETTENETVEVEQVQKVQPKAKEKKGSPMGFIVIAALAITGIYIFKNK